MIVFFKFYVMNFVDSVIDCYTHITSHVTQVFVLVHTLHKLIFAKHCTCYCVCLLVWLTKFEITLSIVWQNIFCGWVFKGRMVENLNFGKTGFKSCVLEKHFISYSCIFISYIQCFEECFQKSGYFFLKDVFPDFRLIQTVFRSIEISFKI